MSRRLSHLGYADWLNHVFDHPAGTLDWYLDLDSDIYDGPGDEAIRHMTRLFGDPRWLPHLFSDDQIAAGLAYLITPGGCDLIDALFDPATPDEARIGWARSQTGLFEHLFAPRLPAILIHRREPGDTRLGLVCYMWWDTLSILPAPGVPDRTAFDAAMVEAMARVLTIDHPACQEAALHGLGHWAAGAPEAVAPVIDAFLAAGRAARPALVDYARAARRGCVA